MIQRSSMPMEIPSYWTFEERKDGLFFTTTSHSESELIWVRARVELTPTLCPMETIIAGSTGCTFSCSLPSAFMPAAEAAGLKLVKVESRVKSNVALNSTAMTGWNWHSHREASFCSVSREPNSQAQETLTSSTSTMITLFNSMIMADYLCGLCSYVSDSHRRDKCDEPAVQFLFRVNIPLWIWMSSITRAV